MVNVCLNNFNYPPPPPPPHHVSSSSSSSRSRRTRSTGEMTRVTASSDRNYPQKSVERVTIRIVPYDVGYRGSDYQRVKKVIEQLGVRSWEVDHGKLTVSTVHYPETIIIALKKEFSSHRTITIFQKQDDVINVSSCSQVDKALLQGMQAMGTRIAALGLVDYLEFSNTKTIDGTEKTAIKVSYANRTGSVPSSVPRDHYQACSHATSSRRRRTTTSQETTSRSYY